MFIHGFLGCSLPYCELLDRVVACYDVLGRCPMKLLHCGWLFLRCGCWILFA
jgi:hypothetical protein